MVIAVVFCLSWETWMPQPCLLPSLLRSGLIIWSVSSLARESGSLAISAQLCLCFMAEFAVEIHGRFWAARQLKGRTQQTTATPCTKKNTHLGNEQPAEYYWQCLKWLTLFHFDRLSLGNTPDIWTQLSLLLVVARNQLMTIFEFQGDCGVICQMKATGACDLAASTFQLVRNLCAAVPTNQVLSR